MLEKPNELRLPPEHQGDKERLATWFIGQLKASSHPIEVLGVLDHNRYVVAHPMRSEQDIAADIREKFVLPKTLITLEQIQEGFNMYRRWNDLISSYPLPIDKRVIFDVLSRGSFIDELGVPPRTYVLRSMNSILADWKHWDTNTTIESLEETAWELNPAQIVIARHYNYIGQTDYEPIQGDELTYKEAVIRQDIFEAISKHQDAKWPDRLTFYKMLAVILEPYFKPPSSSNS